MSKRPHIHDCIQGEKRKWKESFQRLDEGTNARREAFPPDQSQCIPPDCVLNVIWASSSSKRPPWSLDPTIEIAPIWSVSSHALNEQQKEQSSRARDEKKFCGDALGSRLLLCCVQWLS
jgi:hypothetical protein